jgi:hypothetical protein
LAECLTFRNGWVSKLAGSLTRIQHPSPRS